MFFVKNCHAEFTIIKMLLAFVVFIALDSCKVDNGKGKLEASSLSSIYVRMDSCDWDSICKDRSYCPKVYASIKGREGNIEYEGDVLFKTRGNSTWNSEKKSFTMKLPRKDVLFGLERGKEFTLLANSYDESFIRNALAFEIARCIGLGAPYYEFVSLYVNGNYHGLYQIVNKVDVGVDGVDIVDLNKRNKIVNDTGYYVSPSFSEGILNEAGYLKGFELEFDPDDITGGYLLDISDVPGIFTRSSCGFVSNAGCMVRVKSPQKASRAELNYISNAFNEMEAALMDSSGQNPLTGKRYSEYMDVESFALYYWVQELVMNEDAGSCSFFVYKDVEEVDGRFFPGPVWDFDYSLNTPLWHGLWHCENELYANAPTGYGNDGLLFHLNKHCDFQKAVRTVFVDKVGRSVDSLVQSPYLDSVFNLLKEEAERDYTIYPSHRYSHTYKDAVHRVRSFLEKRLDFYEWMQFAGKDEIVSVSVVFEESNWRFPLERSVTFCGSRDKGMRLPNIDFEPKSINEKTPKFFFMGTDRRINRNYRFKEDAIVELRWVKPTFYEKLQRKARRIMGAPNLKP